jgi:hypothetical protein
MNFRRYMAFDNVAIEEFYRATIMGAKSISLLKICVNKQSLTTFMEEHQLWTGNKGYGQA